MTALKRKAKMAAALVLAVFIVSYAALHLLVRSEGFRTRIQSELSVRTGYQVGIDAIRLSPWLGLVGSGVLVSKAGQVLFEGKSIVCFLSPLDFFSRRISHLLLDKPVFHLSLQDLFSPSATTYPNLLIGALNVEDGEFVVVTGHGEPLSLRSVFLNARNLNFGGATALELHTDVPALNGRVALSISGGSEEKRAEIAVGQGEEASPGRFLSGKAKVKTVLTASFQMRRREGDIYEVNGSGDIDQFRLGTESIAGQFESLFEFDAKAKNLLLSLDIKMAQFPAKLISKPIPIQSGPVSATVKGEYSSAHNVLTLRKINVASAIVTVSGHGTIAPGEKQTGLEGALRLTNLAFDSLKPLLPRPLSDFAYSGKIAGDLKISGSYNDPAVTGLAWSEGAKVEGKQFSVSALTLKIPFQWSRSSFQINGGRFQGKDLAWGKKGETQFRIQTTSVVSDIIHGPHRPLTMHTDFEISGGGFSTSGESNIGENLKAKGAFTCRDCNGDASFEGETRIESLELLWNKFFGDFKDHAPAIKLEGRYQRNADELRFNRLHIALRSMGYLELKGSVRQPLANPVFDLEVRSDDLRPAALYDVFIRDRFKARYPILEQIGVSGTSRVALRTRGSLESFMMEGKLRIARSEIQDRSGRWSVGPVDLELPLGLHFPRAPKLDSGEPPPAGKLSILQIKTASSVIPKINAPLVLWNNSLRFPEAIRIPLFGGAALIEKLAWKDVVGAPSDLSFSLRLDDLRLIELTEALGWYRFGGTLSGSIPGVHWAGNSLTSDGSVVLNMFGGRVAVRGLELERPLSPLRSIKMTAGLDGIDLEQASATFEFGRISGVITGTIEDLVITQGQPAEFKAEVETVERAGISQWISVEALNKITVISSGNDGGTLYGGIAGWFDYFRYNKLGFKATLKNDKMILRGVETRDGQEYLVVGTLLPPTVNIVSHTQEIGFSELMRRLERVRKTGGAKSPAHP